MLTDQYATRHAIGSELSVSDVGEGINRVGGCSGEGAGGEAAKIRAAAVGAVCEWATGGADIGAAEAQLAAVRPAQHGWQPHQPQGLWRRRPLALRGLGPQPASRPPSDGKVCGTPSSSHSRRLCQHHRTALIIDVSQLWVSPLQPRPRLLMGSGMQQALSWLCALQWLS